MQIARTAKQNPKRFWKYIKSKTKQTDDVNILHTKINDVSSDLVYDDDEKVKLLNNYFQSVFTIEDDSDLPITNNRILQANMEELTIDKDMVINSYRARRANFAHWK